MELVIGGCFQGKLDYAKKELARQGILVITEEIIDGMQIDLILWEDDRRRHGEQVRILNHFHLWVKDWMEEGREAELMPALEKMLLKHPDLWIVCDEVGCGVVPVEKTERAYRELVGRLLCFLAQKAEHVVRIVAGMPMKIK